MNCVGYPIVWHAPRPLDRLDAIETVAPTIRLSSSEGEPVIACIDHDAKAKTLVTTATGLLLEHDSIGLRAEFAVPGTLPGRELRDALLFGRVGGGSFRWRHSNGATYRWRVGKRPWVREIHNVLVTEVTIAVHGRPAFPQTWASSASPGLEKHFETLARQARRIAATAPQDIQADVVLALPYRRRSWTDEIAEALGIDLDIRREHDRVKATLEKNPTARVIDVRYARTIESALAVIRRREQQQQNPPGPASAGAGACYQVRPFPGGGRRS